MPVLELTELPADVRGFRGRMVVAEAMRRGAMQEAKRMKRAGRVEQARRLVLSARAWNAKWRMVRRALVAS